MLPSLSISDDPLAITDVVSHVFLQNCIDRYGQWTVCLDVLQKRCDRLSCILVTIKDFKCASDLRFLLKLNWIYFHLTFLTVDHLCRTLAKVKLHQLTKDYEEECDQDLDSETLTSMTLLFRNIILSYHLFPHYYKENKFEYDNSISWLIDRRFLTNAKCVTSNVKLNHNQCHKDDEKTLCTIEKILNIFLHSHVCYLRFDCGLDEEMASNLRNWDSNYDVKQILNVTLSSHPLNLLTSFSDDLNSKLCNESNDSYDLKSNMKDQLYHFLKEQRANVKKMSISLPKDLRKSFLDLSMSLPPTVTDRSVLDTLKSKIIDHPLQLSYVHANNYAERGSMDDYSSTSMVSISSSLSIVNENDSHESSTNDSTASDYHYFHLNEHDDDSGGCGSLSDYMLTQNDCLTLNNQFKDWIYDVFNYCIGLYDYYRLPYEDSNVSHASD